MSKDLVLGAATSFNNGLQSEPSNSKLAEELNVALQAVGFHRQQRQRVRTPPKEYPDPQTVLYFGAPNRVGGDAGTKLAPPSDSDSDAGDVEASNSDLPKAVHPPKEKQKLELDDSAEV